MKNIYCYSLLTISCLKVLANEQDLAGKNILKIDNSMEESHSYSKCWATSRCLNVVIGVGERKIDALRLQYYLLF